MGMTQVRWHESFRPSEDLNSKRLPLVHSRAKVCGEPTKQPLQQAHRPLDCRESRKTDEAPVIGAPGRIRTYDLPLRRGMLYPAELPGHEEYR